MTADLVSSNWQFLTIIETFALVLLVIRVCAYAHEDKEAERRRETFCPPLGPRPEEHLAFKKAQRIESRTGGKDQVYSIGLEGVCTDEGSYNWEQFKDRYPGYAHGVDQYLEDRKAFESSQKELSA